MSEQLKSSERHEGPDSSERDKTPEVRVMPEKAPKAEKDPGQVANEARAAIDKAERANEGPDPLEKLKLAESAPNEPTPRHVNRELKQITLQRELKQIRRKLPRRQRVLSKVIHQPVIRVVSETTGKTLSRPSGLLGGGLVALLGTSTYLFLAKERGFPYNYGVFLALFAGGFIVGLVLELAVHLATASRRKGYD
jgi:hypothetical protein